MKLCYQLDSPPGAKITRIEASHFDPGAAWAAVDRHRQEDYRPCIRTHNFDRAKKSTFHTGALDTVLVIESC
jgi:hypothetical protein